MTKRRHAISVAAIAASAILPTCARAVVFYSTPNAAYNTAAPTGPLAGSGWQWQGDWGTFTGTPIAPQYFLTARHTGGVVGTNLVFNGTSYATTNFWNIPNTDLRLWKIDRTFATYAPMYDADVDGSEIGQNIVVFGRGTQRGADVLVPQTTGSVQGWEWGADDHVRRWGENRITSFDDFNTVGDQQLLRFTFDASGPENVGANEAALTGGDSGGGAFIKVGSTWKLAGLNHGVDGPWSYDTTGPTFNAALFDTTGLLNRAGATPVPGVGPAGMYLSRLSLNVDTINGLMTGPPVWNVDAGGNWSDAGNWWRAIPDGVDAEAIFGSVITAQRTVTLDSPRTLGKLTFDNAAGYILAGPNALTIAANSGSGSISVLAGSHTISAPLTLAVHTTISVVPAASTLNLSGSLTATNAIITKDGAGALSVRNVRAAGLNISAGAVRVAPNGGNAGASHLGSLSIAPGAALDLNDNDLAVDYTGASPFTTIRQWVFDGYSASPDPSKTGIISSTGQSAGNTILALFDNALVGATDWPLDSGMTVPANSILGKYTYFGDIDMDGQVTSGDYGLLDANFGSTPLAGLAWLSGDADLDGVVTPGDYGILDANFGAGSGSPLAPQHTAVPEPATLASLAICTGLLYRRSRS
jgi:hypothetical protein